MITRYVLSIYDKKVNKKYIYLFNPNSSTFINRGYDGFNYNLSSKTSDIDNLIENSFRDTSEVRKLIDSIKSENKDLLSYEVVDCDPRDGDTWGIVSHKIDNLEFIIKPLILVPYILNDAVILKKW